MLGAERSRHSYRNSFRSGRRGSGVRNVDTGAVYPAATTLRLPEGTIAPAVAGAESQDPGNPPTGTLRDGSPYYNDNRYQRVPTENMSFGTNFRLTERVHFRIRTDLTNIFRLSYA
jgi:hypothetical protein